MLCNYELEYPTNAMQCEYKYAQMQCKYEWK